MPSPVLLGQDCPHGQQLRSLHWAAGAALLCADILCEIHCRDLKVSQRLTKWELEWQNHPVTLLRLGRRRGVGVLLLLQRVLELWEFVTERSRCEHSRSWLSDISADEECCFVPFLSMFSSKYNLPPLCIFSLFAFTNGLQFCQPIPVAGMERREIVFAVLVIRDPVSTEALHKERKLLVWGICPLNGGRLAGTIFSISGVGNGIQISWVLNPASQVLIGTWSCVAVFAGLLLFNFFMCYVF